MTSPSPINAPEHVLKLLAELHQTSLQQEAELSPETGKFISPAGAGGGGGGGSSGDPEDRLTAKPTSEADRTAFDSLMLDKFIALDEDKCHFLYQLIAATGATNVVEAGTSFGVSTIYLALAVAANKSALGKSGKVIATEKEAEKADVARKYWKQCGEIVEKQIDLRVGDLLETLQEDLPEIDLLLLDIWSALALPTLKTIQPKLRYGAVVLTDNTISGAVGYRDLLAYLRAPESGFQNITLPYTNGFEMSVYLPKPASTVP